MNIAIVAPSSVPFVVGGAEKFWWGLHQAFTRHTSHFVELIKVPCKEKNFWDLIESYKKFYELDLSHFDLVISTKYPAWMVHHNNHVVYLQHTLRGLYDSYNLTGLSTECNKTNSEIRTLINFLDTAPNSLESAKELFQKLEYYKNSRFATSHDFAFPGPLSRKIIHFFDSCGKNPKYISGYAAISQNVKKRLSYFPENVPVEVIHHPSDLSNFQCDEGRYFFTASRLVGCKRLDLIIKSMSYVNENIPLLIAGCGPDLERLKALAGADPRIKFLGFTSDEELVKLYSRAIAVPFVPRDEDYGLITIESMKSGKPVVTADDSGGVCEFVKDGVTGYCVAANPKEIGEALQKIATDKESAIQMGINAKNYVGNITWENTVNRVLNLSKHGAQKKKIVLLNTFSSSRPMSGGQKRVYNICKHLSSKYNIVSICYGNTTSGTTISNTVDSLFKEIIIPLNDNFISKRDEIKNHTSLSVDDIVAMLTCADDKILSYSIDNELEKDSIILCAHPYMFPAIDKTKYESNPLWYDAHNVESVIKEVMFGGNSELKFIVDNVKDTERKCYSKSNLTTCCSDFDKKILQATYGIKDNIIKVLSNGVDIENLQCAGKETRNKNKKNLQIENIATALFIGSNHGPNITAAKFLLEISKKCPDVIFLIAGSVSHNFNNSANHGNLFFIGEVTEKEKNLLLNSCDIGLNPICEGSGTNLKIVEYAAAGMHVISTPHGARGLNNQFIKYIQLAEISEFPDAIMRFKSDIAKQECCSVQLRETVETYYAWEKLVLPIADTLAELTD